MRFRKIFVIGLALSLLGIGVPAWSDNDPRSCNDLMPSDTPAYVVCRWMATPDEAADIARFWLDNDGENMKNTQPVDSPTIDCTEEGNTCPEVPGDSTSGDVGDPDPAPEETGAPECEGGSKDCYVDPSELSAAEVKSAGDTAEGQAVKTAAEAGLRVWIDTDLADDWKAGKLADAVKRVGALAMQEGVVGLRFTSQLGYNQTFTSVEEIDKFMTETTTALRDALPGRKLAVHTVVPVLGCGANEECRTELTKKYPLLDPERVGAWLSKGLVDQLSLDNGHLATEYATWKIDAVAAQRNQWIQVRARAWDAYGTIGAEDAVFTAPGSSQLTAEQALKTITERVATPLQSDAAETVTLWTRWQDPKGTVNRVLGDKLAGNATWEQLVRLSEVKPRLATLYNPAAPEVDVATDLKKYAEAFGQVYLSAV
ncbi:hypothetical protein GCM10010404_67820 [Nonomuraea africana]|uniref:Uncharacterized protein n=1 Tax=Nonomuraea africana TaxID=46171 RepID=A0ABR9KNW6_9ACTN|nr:hypothetical protein [Nonomuraea africana]MBE1563716.1 hypothetical protein [Nonomuraea africana]